MTDEWGNLLLALAQRRDPEPDHAQPIEEVFTELALSDQGVDGNVGRGDDPDVGRHRLGFAQRLDVSRFEKPEQLRLNAPVQLADLVQQEGAPCGAADHSRSVLARVRERPSAVAEQLAVGGVAMQTGAIERDERLL